MNLHAPIARPQMRLLVRVTPKPGVDAPRLEGIYDLITGAMSLRPVEERKSYRPVPPVRNEWSAAELAILREHWPAGGMPACLPRLPGRDRKAIQNKAFRLGLKRQAAPAAAVSIGVRARPFRLDAPAAPAPAPAAPKKPAPVSWVERQQGRVVQSRTFLEKQGYRVTPVDRNSPMASWWVSSFPNPLSSEQLIGLAEVKGMA